eukprot:1189237-Prorocentrum_minimum.AAC.2
MDAGLDGGAVYVTASNDTAFFNCSFEGNYAADDGNDPTWHTCASTSLVGSPRVLLGGWAAADALITGPLTATDCQSAGRCRGRCDPLRQQRVQWPLDH